MAGRAITVVIFAVLMAALVVRNTFIDAYATKNPPKAAAVWSGHPLVILTSGLVEIGAAATTARPVNSAIVRRMRATSAKAPLAPEPFLVRGVEAQVAGDASLALRALLEARRRDPRSIAARYFLADHYLKAGQIQPGLAEISALTRLVPQSLGGVAPQLAAFARMPGGATQIRTLLRDQPQLEPWLLSELAANPGDAGLALSLWSGRINDQDRPWQQQLVNSLVTAGRFEQARKAWIRFNPTARREGELIDPGFQESAMPPFGWTLASGPAGVAEPDDKGGLHILYYGRDDLVLTSQLLMLRPGPYRLAMRVSGASTSARSLAWVVRCLPPSRELVSFELATARRGVFLADFTIQPQACEAQELNLVGTAPELSEQINLTIAELRLTRRGQ